MNTTQQDCAKSFESGNLNTLFTILILIVFTLPFYGAWIVYLLSEVFFLRKKMRALAYRTPTSETNRLYYRHKGDYYKYILMALILFVEPIYVVPAMIGLRPSKNQTNNSLTSDNNIMINLQRDYNFIILTYVLALIFIFLLNTLTKHLINVCKSDCRIPLLPPIQHRFVILTLIMMVLAVVKLAIQGFDILILQILCSIFASYEYYDTRRNSRHLYNLLKWRYEDMRYEPNYPLYKAHRRMALKYKYLTICLLIGLLFQGFAAWIQVPQALFYTVLQFRYPPNVLLPLVKPVIIIKWTTIACAVIGSSATYILVGVSLYYLSAVCWNKMVPYGRNRIYYVQEPQIQQ